MIDETTYQNYLTAFSRLLVRRFPQLDEEKKQQIQEIYAPFLRNLIEAFQGLTTEESGREDLLGRKYLGIQTIIKVISIYLETKREFPNPTKLDWFLTSLDRINQHQIEQTFGPPILALKEVITYRDKMEREENSFPGITLDLGLKRTLVKAIDSVNWALLQRDILPELEKTCRRLTQILHDEIINTNPPSILTTTVVDRSNSSREISESKS